MVGIVLIVYPSFRAYRVVVFPAPSNPSISIFCFFLGIFLSKRLLITFPIFFCYFLLIQNQCHNLLYWISKYQSIFFIFLINITNIVNKSKIYHILNIVFAVLGRIDLFLFPCFNVDFSIYLLFSGLYHPISKYLPGSY